MNFDEEKEATIRQMQEFRKEKNREIDEAIAVIDKAQDEEELLLAFATLSEKELKKMKENLQLLKNVVQEERTLPPYTEIQCSCGNTYMVGQETTAFWHLHYNKSHVQTPR